MKTIVRFAPSPTGNLHVGGARTAIFNWIFAQKSGGRFLLRIEDTDRERSNDASIQQIFSSMQWLGLEWDDEVCYQSKQGEYHRQVTYQLLDSGHAYRCFCTREELADKRRIAAGKKQDFGYDGTCRRLNAAAVDNKLKAGMPFSIRFKVPGYDIAFDDLIKGKVCFSSETLDDFIILRSDGSPVYQIAVVADDHRMGITTVMRGEDHLSNTPKQILLYRALGWDVPQFGHLPLILGPDKVRLSKRHGATSVEEFRDRGILPDALFNYLCLLGWSPGDDSEFLDRDVILKRFDNGKINSSPAVFDENKLYWLNGKYIAKMELAEVMIRVRAWLDKNNLIVDESESSKFELFVDLLKIRSRTITELTEGLRLYFDDPRQYDPKGVKKFFMKEPGGKLLRLFYEEIKEQKYNIFDDVSMIENTVRAFAEKHEAPAAKIIHPLRLALTGKTESPGIFEMIRILGKVKVGRRLRKACAFIEKVKNDQ